MSCDATGSILSGTKLLAPGRPLASVASGSAVAVTSPSACGSALASSDALAAVGLRSAISTLPLLLVTVAPPVAPAATSASSVTGSPFTIVVLVPTS